MASCTTTGPRVTFDESIFSDRARAGYHYLRYEDLMNEEKIDSAQVELEKALELMPTPQLYLELANIYWQKKNIVLARQTLEQAIDRYPGHKPLYSTLARSYLAEQKYLQAGQVLESYLGRTDNDQELIKELSAIYIQAEEHGRAKDLLTTVPAPDYDAELHYLLAQAQNGLGRRDKAIDELKSAIDFNPGFLEAWFELGYLYELEQDFASAESTYQQLLEMGENSEEVLLRLIRLNLQLNNADKAFDLATGNDRSEQFLLQTGEVFIEEKFYGHARKIFTILEEKPDPPQALYFYQALLAFEADNNPEKSLEHIRRIDREDPLYDKTIDFQIQLLIQLDRLDEAREMIQEARERTEPDPSLWILESAIEEEKNNFDQSLSLLNQGLESFPDNIDLLTRKGFLLERMEKRQQAMEIMERIISADPNNTDALNYIGYTLADEGRDLERALVMIRSALKNEPDSGYIIDSLAWVHYKRGELEKAWKEIQRAVDKVDNDPIIWEHYGDIALAVNKKDLARKGYEKALTFEPKDPETLLKKLNNL